MKEATYRCAEWLLLVGSVCVAVGCGPMDSRSRNVDVNGTKATQGAAQARNEPKKVHDHSGWWCDEHGVPEAECSQCSAKVAAACKKNGDWCQLHDRAKSQCFLCDPSLKDKYAALYRAKTGKEPPPTEDEEKAKKDEKK